MTAHTALASAARDASALPVAGGAWCVTWRGDDGAVHAAFVDVVDWHAVDACNGCVARNGNDVTETIAHMEEVA
jgi:hypothetical protein